MLPPNRHSMSGTPSEMGGLKLRLEYVLWLSPKDGAECERRARWGRNRCPVEICPWPSP